MDTCFSKEDNSTPLLSQPIMANWKTKVKSCLYRNFSCNKAILLILFWQFSTGLTQNLLLIPSAYLQLADPNTNASVASLIALLFLFISPLAGFIADVKFGRYKALLCSSYLMVGSVSLILLMVIILTYAIHSYHFYLYLSLVFFALAILLYLFGRIVFLANVLQFGTDQLRDAPTYHSVLFLYAYYWCDSLSRFLMLSTNIPGHEIIIIPHEKLLSFDKLKVIIYIIVLLSSAVSSIVILFIIKRKKHWFLTESIMGNPYKLVYQITNFAIRHNKPIRRSAFTFCENHRISRLDFAKIRYGGPFTTEQVEDVKVLFNMLKIFLAICPIFFLDFSAISSVMYHIRRDLKDYEVHVSVELFLLEHGTLSPLLSVFYIPLYLLVLKPLLNRYFPNMFKRMGLSVILLIALFTCYLVYDLTANSSIEYIGDSYLICKGNITDAAVNKDFHSTNRKLVFILENTLSSIFHTLLYIAIWEFICCQSPQHMKGLLFGLFYALKAFVQFLAAISKIVLLHNWKRQLIDCESGYYLVNIMTGLITLTVFSFTARRYQYRKRDDICNVYQYAEDYYSNIP